jgi:hypothetical protein
MATIETTFSERNLLKHVAVTITIKRSRWHRSAQWIGFGIVRFGMWLVGVGSVEIDEGD